MDDLTFKPDWPHDKVDALISQKDKRIKTLEEGLLLAAFHFDDIEHPVKADACRAIAGK